MNTERNYLYAMIDQIPDSDLPIITKELTKIIQKLLNERNLFSITDILKGVAIHEEKVSPEEMKIINERMKETDSFTLEEAERIYKSWKR